MIHRIPRLVSDLIQHMDRWDSGLTFSQFLFWVCAAALLTVMVVERV